MIWSVLALAAAGALGSSHILADQGPACEDWTGFLGGPERRATVSGEGLLKTWPTNGPALVWESRAIGVSMGEVLIVGANVYAWGVLPEEPPQPQPERDTNKKIDTPPNDPSAPPKVQPKPKPSRRVLTCLDLATGAVRWQVDTQPHMVSTPAYDGGRIVLQNQSHLFCYDARSGELLWKVDGHAVLKEAGVDVVRLPGTAYACWVLSPLAFDGMAVLPLGQAKGLAVALEMATGKPLWIAKGNKPFAGISWSSPKLIRMEKRRLILLPTMGNLVGLDAADGTVLWEEECYDSSVNSGNYTWACPPAFDDGLFFIYGGYRSSRFGVKPEYMLRWSTYRLIADGQRIEKVWNKPNISPFQENVIVHGGRLYGTGGQTTWTDFDENPGLLLNGQSYSDLANAKGEQNMAQWRQHGDRRGMPEFLKSTGVDQGHPLVCQDLKTGRIEGRRGLHQGPSCYGDHGLTLAGDRLYVSRSGGQTETDAVYLVEASPSMTVHGSVTFPLKQIIASHGPKPGWNASMWTRPIVARGFMLIRIGSVLRAYDLRADERK
jgi:outer membrane protein assembly factor BamB